MADKKGAINTGIKIFSRYYTSGWVDSGVGDYICYAWKCPACGRVFQGRKYATRCQCRGELSGMEIDLEKDRHLIMPTDYTNGQVTEKDIGRLPAIARFYVPKEPQMGVGQDG
jgi:hypothetical protein